MGGGEAEAAAKVGVEGRPGRAWVQPASPGTTVPVTTAGSPWEAVKGGAEGGVGTTGGEPGSASGSGEAPSGGGDDTVGSRRAEGPGGRQRKTRTAVEAIKEEAWTRAFVPLTKKELRLLPRGQ